MTVVRLSRAGLMALRELRRRQADLEDQIEQCRAAMLEVIADELPYEDVDPLQVGVDLVRGVIVIERPEQEADGE